MLLSLKTMVIAILETQILFALIIKVMFLLNIDWHHKKTPLETQESKGVGG